MQVQGERSSATQQNASVHLKHYSDIDAVNHRIWEAAHEDPEGSASQARTLIQRCTELGYVKGRAEALRTLGYTRAIADDYAAGFEAAQEAHDILDPSDSEHQEVLATVHDLLSNLHLFVGMHGNSFEHARSCIEMAQRAGSTRVEAYGMRNLGVIFMTQHEYRDARRLFLESLNLFTSIDYHIGVAWNTFHLAEVEMHQSHFESALQHLERVHELISPQEVGMLHANTLNARARCLREIGRFRDALEVLGSLGSYGEKYGQIRAETEIPVATVGGITEPEHADALIRNERADLVALGREMLRNPYWPLQAAHELDAEIEWPPQYRRGQF